MNIHRSHTFSRALRYLAIILLFAMAITCLSSCKKKEDGATETTIETTTGENTNDMIIPDALSLVAAGGFFQDGVNLQANIVDEQPTFDFTNRIRVPLGSNWCLTSDAEGTTDVTDKSVYLMEGENNFFIKVKFRDESLVYHVTIQYHAAYAVEFYTNSNEYIKTQQVDFGKKIQKPADPTREGYTFNGWFLNGSPFDFETAPTESCTLIAHWTKKSTSFSPSDTTVPTFTTSGASLHVVWKDYANSNALRPDSVTCLLEQTCDGTTNTYKILLRENGASWEAPTARPDGAVLKQGQGGAWTLTVTSLPDQINGKACSYTLKQAPTDTNYATLQSGSAVINTIKGYMPSVDDSARLTTRNSRLYDAAGNMVVLKGVVTLNVGVDGLDNSTSPSALEYLASTGCNAIRLTAQLVGQKAGQGYVYYYNGSARTGDYNDKNAVRMSKADQQLMLTHIDKVIENATDAGLYVVIDWGILTSNPYQYINEACEFFGILADKYADNPYVMFEICNEPKSTWGRSSGVNNSIKAYAERVIDTIRSAGSDAIIILAPNNSATALSVYSGSATAGDDPIDDPLDDDRRYNVAYTFHCYPYNYAYTTYSWKLRDAYNAGLTVITTEMSPMDGTFDGPDKLSFDMQEAAKFQRMYMEWDISFFYFRYASNSNDDYHENLMFIPNLNLSTRRWTRDDLTECGKWYYDWVTGDGVYHNVDFNTTRIKDLRPNYDTTHADFGLGNVFPGFATSATLTGTTYFFKTGNTDTLTNVLYNHYCSIIRQRLTANAGNIKNADGSAFTANDIPQKTSDVMDITYQYNGKTVTLKLSYGPNTAGDAYGIMLDVHKIRKDI